MDYERWCQELFGCAPDDDPVSRDLSQEFVSLAPHLAFDYIDRMLNDEQIHQRFSPSQLGIGLNIVYSNCCSDLPFVYTTACDDQRRVAGIENLSSLYSNFFDRYCEERVAKIGSSSAGDRMAFICYMLWDIFVLYPENGSEPMTRAAIAVMNQALRSRNESSIISALHGLGHWGMYRDEPSQLIEQWLKKPSTSNPVVLEYARAAKTGMIL